MHQLVAAAPLLFNHGASSAAAPPPLLPMIVPWTPTSPFFRLPPWTNPLQKLKVKTRKSNYRWTAPPRSLFQAPCDFFPNISGTLYPTSPSSLPPRHPSLPSTDNHAKQEAFVSPLQPSTYTLSIPELAGHKKILKLQLKTAFPIKGTSGCTQIKQIKSRYALTGTGIQYGKPRTPVGYPTGTRYTFYYRGRYNAVPRPTWTKII